MPIAPLSDFTIRAIGSSLVLNDACSVVKELIDNALDASATSVVVEISLNALDVIQVKDNGHGIGVEDRRLVCKRGCTSKIRAMEDLEKLGGSSLGFRGEALASVAEMSEAVTLTTRVDGEVVGTILKFGRDGTLQNSASASHPVGTTLRIQGFLHALPVRKEVAKKDGAKTLANIKKLLYAYAYARTSVRFALKLLRANSERANWSYSPNLGPVSLQDTVTKIAGQDVATQCELRSADLQQTVSQSAERVLYSVDAVIVRVDAEASKAQNVGTYVSIDGRPVNPARGVIKNVVKLYRSFYRAASGNVDRKPSNIDPFLCMHIRCPPQSYDVNIEPAKDDVLFSEPLKVMTLVEKLFRDYYGEIASDTPTRSRPSVKHQAKTAPDDSFGLLLARKAAGTAEISAAVQSTLPMQCPASAPGRTRAPNVEPLRNATDICHAPVLVPEPLSFYQSDRSPHQPTHAVCRSSVEGSKLHFNVYGVDDEDLFEMTSPPSTQHPLSEEADENEVRSARVTNPWSLAKLNAPARQSVGEPSTQADSGLTAQLMTPGRKQNNQSRNLQRLAYPQQSAHPYSILPFSVASSPTPVPNQNPGPPIRRRVHNEQQDQGDGTTAFTQDFVTKASHPCSANTLETWVQPRQPAVDLLSFMKASASCNWDDEFGTAGRPDFERQERNLDDSLTRLAESDDFSTEPSRTSNHIRKPFKSPIKGRSVTPSRYVANLGSLDSSCISLLPAPPPPKAQVTLPDRAPASQRRLLAIDYGNQSISIPPPSSPSQCSFKMPQSPNTELAEILEFERRKKAAVLHQRKSQSNRALNELTHTKLASVQRKTDETSSAQVVSSKTSRDLPSLDLKEKQSNPACPLERDAKSPYEGAGSLINRNNPHRNRYLAAKERLGQARLESDDKQYAGYSDQKECNAGELLDETEVRLAENDPRAYLVWNSESGQKTDSLSGLTRTGLKIRRAKTDRLPLETISASAANKCLKAITPAPFPSISPLAVMSRRQSQCDEYIRSGKNCFVKWSTNSRDVTTWEKTLKELISKGYNARLAGGEIVPPELTVMLTTAIKAHADVYGS